MTHHLIPRRRLVTILGLLTLSVSAQAITLTEYAKQNPLVIQTVRPSEGVDLGKENQVNDLKEGGKVLVLSGKHLTSVEGIGALTVMGEGKPVALSRMADR